MVEAYSTDTGDDAAVKKTIADIASVFGRIDILVNCAAQPGGQGKPPSLTEITNEHFWADMNVKVMGYLRTSREVAPHMIKAGSGRIIHVSGLAARSTGTIIGSMRNVAVAALTKNMADELAPHGIAVVCVHPGLTRTEKTPASSPLRPKPRVSPKPRSKPAWPAAISCATDHHGGGDCRRRGLSGLAQGRRRQRRCDRCGWRRTRRDPLLGRRELERVMTPVPGFERERVAATTQHQPRRASGRESWRRRLAA